MCDTFIALRDATQDGSIIFAKNSDRPAGEGQTRQLYPAATPGAGERLRCTYIEIPQAETVHAVLLSQIDWMWGAEMGANEHGVVIGNEAVWTSVPSGPPALLGMDLLRLGLERGKTAREALDVMAKLLEEFGQGGACARNDAGFTYDNSFLIADLREAWVLETAGRFWAAKRITTGIRNISNRLSIRQDYDLASKDPPGDFAACFSVASLQPEPGSRETWGARLLAEKRGAITPETMKEVLRHHESGICMHGGFETTSSMITRMSPNGEVSHWMTDGPNPCQAKFDLVDGFPFAADRVRQAV